MRNVGKELGVKATSLYHHVAGKDALLDGPADWTYTQIDVPNHILGRDYAYSGEFEFGLNIILDGLEER